MFLTDNPIADMPGPIFVAVYAAVWIVLMLLGMARLRARGRGTMSPVLPEQPDPYEAAYLAGGNDQVVRLAVFMLTRDGVLRLSHNGKPRWRRLPTLVCDAMPADGVDVSAVPRAVLTAFADTSEIPFTDTAALRTLPAVEAACQAIEARLIDIGWLNSEATRQRMRAVMYQHLALFLALGLYKLVIALLKGHHNVILLLAEAFVGGIFLLTQLTPSSVSTQGRAMLKQLKTAMKGRAPAATIPLLAVAVLGIGALSDATAYRMILVKPGDSGGADGGGSDSGGGGGGGCGGCGS